MPTAKGILLAIVNVIVIGFAFGIIEHDEDVWVLVMMFGSVPAVVLGGLLGFFAGLTAKRSPFWRSVLLALPAFGLVAILGETFSMTAAVGAACLPTMAAALLLERWTRQTPLEPVPVATARSIGP